MKWSLQNFAHGMMTILLWHGQLFVGNSRWKVPQLFQLLQKLPLQERMNCFEKTYICATLPHCVNSLWPSDGIWWPRSESTLAQVMAASLMEPSHYQCCLIKEGVLWPSPENNFTRNADDLPSWRVWGLQYIPRNMHTVLLCFALLWLCNRS